MCFPVWKQDYGSLQSCHEKLEIIFNSSINYIEDPPKDQRNNLVTNSQGVELLNEQDQEQCDTDKVFPLHYWKYLLNYYILLIICKLIFSRRFYLCVITMKHIGNTIQEKSIIYTYLYSILSPKPENYQDICLSIDTSLGYYSCFELLNTKLRHLVSILGLFG